MDLVRDDGKILFSYPGEGAGAYHAFLYYVALGPSRSLRKLVEVLGRKPSYVKQLENWSSAFHWVDRAHTYDAHYLEQLLVEEAEKRVSAVRDLARDHAKLGEELQKSANEVLERAITRGKLRPREAIALLKLSVELRERSTRDLSQPDGTDEVKPVVIDTIWGTSIYHDLDTDV